MQRIAGGQDQLDLGLGARADAEPLPITSSRAQHLWSALAEVYELLGFDEAAEGDEVFRQLVLARIIEPTSKADSLRVIDEAGIAPVSCPTLNRRLPVFAKPVFRQALSAACAAHARLGPASLALFDVSTLYFETDAGDGFGEPGFSKERRLEPQITLGLLTDASGMPLMVDAFGGNKAETATMLPVITAFDGLILTQRWPSSTSEKARGVPDRMIHDQYRADRARRTSRGIDEQIAKA